MFGLILSGGAIFGSRSQRLRLGSGGGVGCLDRGRRFRPCKAFHGRTWGGALRWACPTCSPVPPPATRPDWSERRVLGAPAVLRC
jgi:hypothetical protein